MPGRRFPGSVVQGDSLHSIYSSVRELESHLRDVLGANHESVELAAWIAFELHERLWWYEQELKRAGYNTLPYPTSVGAPVEPDDDRPVA